MLKKTALLFSVLFIAFLTLSCSGQKPNGKSVYITQVANPETMLTKLNNSEIDGFLLWEPYPHEAVLKKYGVMLKKSSEIWPNHPDCVIAAANQGIDRPVLQAFIWTHIKATRFIANPDNREKVIKYAMEFTGKDRQIVEASMSNIRWEEFPDEKEFENYYHELTKSPILTRTVTDLGYSSNRDFFNRFLDKTDYEIVSDKLSADPDWLPEPVKPEKPLRFARIVPGLFHLPSYIAEREGFYQDIGLIPGKNLIIQDYPHGIAIMQKFKTNEIDVAYVGVAPATLKRINDEVDIRVVAGVEGQDSGLVVRKGLNINSVADLEGKTLAVPAIGNVQYVILEKAIREAGLKPVVK